MPVPDDYKPSDTKPESKHLRAEDFPLDQKWKLKVEDVNIETMPARDGKKERKRLILIFVGRQKGLVLNATNQGFVEARLGTQPNDWIGADIILHRTTTIYAEKTVPAFRILECRKGNPPPPPQREAGDDDAPF